MKSFMEGIDRGFEVVQVFGYLFENFLYIAGAITAWFGFCFAAGFVVLKFIGWASELYKCYSNNSYRKGFENE